MICFSSAGRHWMWVEGIEVLAPGTIMAGAWKYLLHALYTTQCFWEPSNWTVWVCQCRYCRPRSILSLHCASMLFVCQFRIRVSQMIPGDKPYDVALTSLSWLTGARAGLHWGKEWGPLAHRRSQVRENRPEAGLSSNIQGLAHCCEPTLFQALLFWSSIRCGVCKLERVVSPVWWEGPFGRGVNLSMTVLRNRQDGRCYAFHTLPSSEDVKLIHHVKVLVRARCGAWSRPLVYPCWTNRIGDAFTCILLTSIRSCWLHPISFASCSVRRISRSRT